MPWTTPQQVVDNWIGDNPPTDVNQLKNIINNVELLIRRVYPKIQTRIDSGDLDQGLINLVTYQAINDLIKTESSPFVQETQTQGNFSRSVSQVSSLRAKITKLPQEALDLLAPINNYSKAFNINPAPDMHVNNTEYFSGWHDNGWYV